MTDEEDFSIDEQEKPTDDVEWDNELHPNEINDILGFDLSAEEGEDRSGLKALINSAFVSHRRMPMLDVIFDRAARQMTTSLRHLTNDNADVALDDISALRFGEFITSVPEPSVVGVLRAEALGNFCLIAVDATLVFSIVDLLLGGRREGAVLSFDDRGFTQIELGLVEKVITLLAEDLSASFRPVCDVAFKLDRLETTPRFAAIAQDASVCSLAKFRVDMEDRGGRAAILFPHAMLEPIQKILRREFISESGDGDRTWRDSLFSGVSAASVDLRAVIAEKEISIASLSELKCGDTINFSGVTGERADIRAGDMTVATAKVGKAGDAIALRLFGGRKVEPPLQGGVAPDEEAA